MGGAVSSGSGTTSLLSLPNPTVMPRQSVAQHDSPAGSKHAAAASTAMTSICATTLTSAASASSVLGRAGMSARPAGGGAVAAAPGDGSPGPAGAAGSAGKVSGALACKRSRLGAPRQQEWARQQCSNTTACAQSRRAMLHRRVAMQAMRAQSGPARPPTRAASSCRRRRGTAAYGCARSAGARNFSHWASRLSVEFLC